MRILLIVSTLLSMAFAANPERVGLCRLLNEPSRFSGKVVEVQGYIKPLMHGTYLKQEGCDQSLFLVLPDEIPNYKGAIKVVRDAGFEAFEKARFNYQPDAPRYSATFVGELEYAKRGKGFGYNKNHRVRLVLQSVR
jgi:hypothetical protein